MQLCRKGVQVPRTIKKKGSRRRHHGQTKISNLTKLLCGPIRAAVRTVPVGVGAAHVAPLMRGDLAGPQMKQSGAASTSSLAIDPYSRSII
ncbi:hypothetical protein THAOC_15887 [Thalassiosira oceanica]|uniref:Uncharacterized protein n=1 Tax=Thalassiosira oceanica TaxID=159749 RepID=K0SQV5_THAOC|nr:hypothetical protein THAOC_15887 [Thalassiosira oceanica]|eukprot:EJK63451.1 hypothetical protein THAOC_15887 [Thalassiosira oceanica]